MFVCAYGSLVHPGEGVPCRLRGFRRGWDVAMDNRRTIPGYKYYLDAETGERPAVYVTFLSISPADGGELNGVAFPAEDGTLAALDARERSYERWDVTGRVDLDLGGPVYAYVGRAEARSRLQAGRRAGTAVVSREYLEHVRGRFEALGLLAEFERTTEPLSLPVRALRRLDVP
jgi:cation transport regulator ChaC